MEIGRPLIIAADAAFPLEILDRCLLPALGRGLERLTNNTVAAGDDAQATLTAFRLLDDEPGSPFEGRHLNYAFWGAYDGHSFVAGGTLQYTCDACTQQWHCLYKMKLTVNSA